MSNIFEDLAKLDGRLLRIRLVACAAIVVLVFVVTFFNRDVLLTISDPALLGRIGTYWGQLQQGVRSDPLTFAPMIWRFLSYLIGLAAFTLAIAGIVLGALRLVARTLWTTLVHWRSAVPADAPEGFRDIDEVISALTTRKMAVTHDPHPFLKATFGTAASFIPPSARRFGRGAAERLSALSLRIAGYLILAAIILGGISFLHMEDVLDAMANPEVARQLTQVDAVNAAIMLSPPFMMLLAMVAVLAIADFVFLRAVVPKRLPATDSESLAETMSASTDYRNIINQLPNKAEARRLQDMSNRVAQIDAEEASASISDSGKFEARLAIEQQPVPTGNPVDRAARLRLIVGWILYGLGILVGGLLVLPTAAGQFFQGLEVARTSVFVPPVLALLYLFVSYRLRSAGLAHISAGEQLFNVQRFTSNFVFIRLRGTQNRAEIRIGRGQTDSVETSTQVTHPEFLAEVWAASIEAEVSELNQSRELVSMTRSSGSHEWLEGTFADIRELCAKRADVVGVRLDNEDLQDVVRGNINITARTEAEKAMAMQHMERELAAANFAITARPDANQTPDLLGHSRYCGSCGTPAAPDGLFCTKCGKKLVEAEEA